LYCRFLQLACSTDSLAWRTLGRSDIRSRVTARASRLLKAAFDLTITALRASNRCMIEVARAFPHGGPVKS
jgi:hypothetical protein